MSAPAIAPSMAAASAALRAIGPTWSIDSARANIPARLTRPHVGLRPVTPFIVDGKRIEPNVSVPKVPEKTPTAVATPEPLEETPVQWARLQGLTGGAIDA